VAPGSRTETFVALKLFVDNWRWADVPFYIRSGKRLPERVTTVVVRFRRTPHLLFAGLDPGIASNSIVIRIQPDEGFSLRFGTKEPGSSLLVRPVTMDFRYDRAFGGRLVEAYTRLLLDCMVGDQTLYARGDSVDTAWTLITPILEAWKTNPASSVHPYPAGSWGPREADALLAADGRRWRME
jgi:glucose-6-phosphate 1-dehydrogenase